MRLFEESRIFSCDMTIPPDDVTSSPPQRRQNKMGPRATPATRTLSVATTYRGAVGVSDVMLMLRHVVGLNTPARPRSPAAGFDPDGRELSHPRGYSVVLPRSSAPWSSGSSGRATILRRANTLLIVIASQRVQSMQRMQRGSLALLSGCTP